MQSPCQLPFPRLYRVELDCVVEQTEEKLVSQRPGAVTAEDRGCPTDIAATAAAASAHHIADHDRVHPVGGLSKKGDGEGKGAAAFAWVSSERQRKEHQPLCGATRYLDPEKRSATGGAKDRHAADLPANDNEVAGHVAGTRQRLHSGHVEFYNARNEGGAEGWYIHCSAFRALQRAESK